MKWFRNVKLGTKLISSFIVVALIAGVIGVIGSINMNRLNTMETTLYESNMKKVLYMSRWLEEFNTIRTIIRDIYISNDRDYQTTKRAEIAEIQKLMDQYIVEFEARVESQLGHDLVAKLRTQLVDYRKDVASALDLSMEGRKAEAEALIYGPLLDKAVALDATATEMVDDAVDLATAMDKTYTKTADTATVLMLVLAAAGMILAVALGLLIARMISRPIQALVDASKKVADGDMNIDIVVDSKDEIGTLAQSFAAMTDSMNDVLHNITSASEQVASGSRQVSEASQTLSQGSTEQASSIQQLTASMEQIASQTKQNAVNAEQANQLAIAASTDAEQGNNQMKEMLAAMEQINESSGNISKIIKVIDEIAFQTNILALNAAVEAARAGQHGKGFAVVAEEVRNLAARSANAAKETTTLIEGSIKKVEAGTKIANDTAQALEKMRYGADQAVKLIGSIATASNEQAIGITQVNQGIAQVSEVIQANSATSEECAAASEELSGQSEQLKAMVGRFRLKRSASAHRGGEGGFAGNRSIYARMAASPAALEAAAASAGKPRIQLDDNDFGKYE
ncbi:methyl-accepting chemotaxis protein [Paenibacillus sp.]|uniref:methyl-accepting chemotaxis protein n=1 Tax=Paenibacillus sp. TaxID=58172 RepID=UPI002D2A0028|nr:methyl-accepting chemotaxis protein [Paenibacillus sp.]HZG84172.1 methyl-accepting chemotaxis protein [Paenibacillus sp.]